MGSVPYLGFVDAAGHQRSRSTLLPAAFSLAAAAVHFAYAGAHFGEDDAHGLFFLIVGALQAAWALALTARPSRLLRLAGVLNLGVVGVWAATRGDEGIGVADAWATGLELGIVALVLARLRMPRVLAGVVVVLVAAGTLVSLSPQYAEAEHAHGDEDDDHGHVEAQATPAATTPGTTPCEQSGPPLSPAQVAVTEGHSHRGAVPQKPLTAAERLHLAEQQKEARTVVDRFPTVAAAAQGGYKKSTPFVPCIGAHYTNFLLAARFAPAQPAELLFDGTEPDSKLVGLSYLVYHPGGPPDGFAGPNDVWHQHNANGGLCFDRSGFVLAGEDASAEQCRELGGVKRELTDVWMLHDWIVPGWECTWGVFAPECPELGGKLGLSAWD